MSSWVEVELRRVRMPLVHPHRAAHGDEDDREVILVAIRDDDGIVGWGECPALRRPTYTAEYLDGAWAVLRDHIVPGLFSLVSASEELLERAAPGETVESAMAFAGGRGLEAIVGNHMATGAVEDAMLDGLLRRSRSSLAGWMGEATRPLPATTVIGIVDSMDELLARVDAAPGPVKLKMSGPEDIDRLDAVRQAFPARDLAADANGSIEVDWFEDPEWTARLDEIGLTYLEQPVAGVADNALVSALLSTPLCLDEAIDSVDVARLAMDVGAMQIVNVKPARLGGVANAREVVELAAERGVDAFVGGMLETGVGRAGALAVALLPGCTLPTDLGPSSQYWATDITEPILADERGWLIPPTGPGIGVTPDPDRLDAATVDRLVFRR